MIYRSLVLRYNGSCTVFSSAYNEYTVISKEYTGPLDFDITGVNCIYVYENINLIIIADFNKLIWNSYGHLAYPWRYTEEFNKHKK